jgi:hypothetical protein
MTMIKTDLPKQRILAEELAPGDLILLAEGDHISADARLIQEAELRVDQSTLKGNGALTSDFTAVGASTPHREGNYSCLYQRGLKPVSQRAKAVHLQQPGPYGGQLRDRLFWGLLPGKQQHPKCLSA